MQRSLIWQRSRKQGRSSGLMLDLQSLKSVLPDRIKVPLHTDLHLHLAPLFLERVAAFLFLAKEYTRKRGAWHHPSS
jgi:hypothetical protein